MRQRFAELWFLGRLFQPLLYGFLLWLFLFTIFNSLSGLIHIFGRNIIDQSIKLIVILLHRILNAPQWIDGFEELRNFLEADGIHIMSRVLTVLLQDDDIAHGQAMSGEVLGPILIEFFIDAV